MFCEHCLALAANKLLPEDIIVLEYLGKEKANISQCSISRSTIKNDCNLSDYKCYTALDRLELFDMVAQQIRSKSNKYFITEAGQKILSIIEDKMVVG